MTETRQKKIKIELFKEQETYTIYNGSMLVMSEAIEPNSIDAIVTDPPYHLKSITERFGKENSAPAKYGEDGSFSRLSKGFMNQTWDGGDIAFRPKTWRKCYEALKPGGYLLAFGGSRTFHRMAVAIEDAGFEIRDTIMWIYGSGFPKSANIAKGIEAKEKYGNSGTRNKRKVEQDCDSEEFVVKQPNNGILGEIIETTRKKYNANSDLAKQWQGWGTALKPAYEPIIVARKPIEGTVVENVMRYGTGGINIDECRIPFEDTQNPATNPLYRQRNNNKYKQIKKGQESNGAVSFTSSKNDISSLGRFPANVIHDGSDEVATGFPESSSNGGNADYSFGNQDNTTHLYTNIKSGNHFKDSGNASRFFYSAKASKKDRDEGLDLVGFEETRVTDGSIRTNQETAGKFCANSALRRNIHPTVKPCELMQYLVRLVAPKGATILDPFMGSGSTGKAVMFENRERSANYKFIGVDLEQKYCQIANARIDYALNKYEYDVIKEQQQAKSRGQTSIFDFLEG